MTEIVLTATHDPSSEPNRDRGCLPPIHIHLHFPVNPSTNGSLWPLHPLKLDLTLTLNDSTNSQPLPGGRPHPIPDDDDAQPPGGT